MALVWKGGAGNVVATGKRGIYTIQSLSTGDHVLQRVTTPDPTRKDDLAGLGRTFTSVDAAKGYALESEKL